MAVAWGGARSWHPGYALYCLWRWARRGCPHTKDWTATWRIHLDGQQQLEAIPQQERTTETPATGSLCPVFAIHQIRALAPGGQLLPTIGNETEAQAAHAALVQEIFSALRSALVRRLGNPPRALTHRKPKPGTCFHIHARRHHGVRRSPPNTAQVCPARCDRSPAVEGHHTGRRTLQELEEHRGPYEITHPRVE